MVAVVSGSGLGLNTSSLSSLGTVGGVGTSAGGSNGERIYVNAATGNLVLQSHDEVLAGLGLDVAVVRTYNSQGQLNDGDNGDNWRLGVYRRVYGLTGTVNTLNSTVVKVFGDGAEVSYRHNGTIYVGTDGEGAHDTLSFNVSTQQWTWTDGSSRASETYDVNGRLLSASDTDGNVVAFGYTGALLTQVTDASGQITYLDYTGNNLTQVRVVSQSVTQTITRYTYDGQNRLSTVTGDLSPGDNSISDNAFYRTTYTYDGTSTRVASIAQSRGTSAAHASVSFTYELLNGEYRLKTFTDGESRVTTFTYTQASTSSTPITVPANPAVLSTTQQQEVNTPYNLNSGLLTNPAGSWAVAATLETGAGAAHNPLIAFDDNGNGFAVWRSGHDVLARRYTRSTNTWAAATVLDSLSNAANTVEDVALAVDAAGNAVVGWVQKRTTSGGGEPSVYARFFNGSSWGTATLQESLTNSMAAGNNSLAVAVNGARAAIAFLEIASGVNNVWVSSYENGTWYAAESVETGSATAANVSIAIDNQTNISALWQQSDGTSQSTWHARYLNQSPYVFSAAVQIDGTTSAAAEPKIAFNTSGNGVAVWRVGNDLVARHFTQSTNSWGSPITLDSSADTLSQHSLAVDANGNAIVAWVQSDGTAASVYARRYDVATTTWGTAALLESSSTAVSTTAPLSVSIEGTRAAVAWLQTSDLHVASLASGTWSAPSLIESAGDAAAQPSVAIDNQGNVTVVWRQLDASVDSIYQRRYTAGAGGTPYFTVPAGATWQSIGTTLYGSSVVATQLATALGNPTLTTGLQLTGFPATITVTTYETVTVPAYYTVPSGATWSSVTQAIYGTGDAAAVTALQTALGTSTLPSAGTNLTVPLSLTYNGTITRYLQTDVSDPLGRVTTFAQDAAGRLVGVLSPTVNGVRLETRYTYDANTGDLLTVTQDPLGLNRITTHVYDANGNVLTSRDSLGNTLTRTYSSANQLLNETRYVVPDPDGGGSGQPGTPLTTRYAYDGEQHLRFVVSADGRVTEHQYNAAGQRISTLQYTDALYDVSGVATATALTEGQLTTWTSARDLTRLQRLDYAYDFRGNVTSATAFAATNSSGVGQAAGSSITRFVYDQRGKLLQTIDPRGEATAGDPNDYRTTYTYDGLGRVLTSTEWIDATTTRTATTAYQDENNRIVINHANGLVTTSNFNRAGELQTVQNVAPSILTTTTTFAYDGNGRLRMVTDPMGNRAFHLYDEAGRKVAEVDADGTLTEFIYNRTSQVVKTVEYAVRVTSGQLTALANSPGSVTLGDLRAVADDLELQDRVTRAAYDSAGRLVYAIDELGAVTQNLYDGAGRVVETVQYATTVSIPRTTDEVLPGALSVTSVPASDRRARNFYDNGGSLLATLDAAGYLVEYFYDGAGRLTRSLAYANETPTALRATGTLTQLRPAADDEIVTDPERDASTYFLYDNQGRRNGVLDAEGRLTETIFDAAGRVWQQVRYGGTNPIGYVAGATIATLRPASAPTHTTTFLYDGAGRVVQETNFEGTVTVRNYDHADNVVSATTANGTAEARTRQARYDALGRMVAELSGEGSLLIVGGMTQPQIDAIWTQYGVRYTYDLSGRRTSSTVSPSGSTNLTTYFYYDADGRQTHVVNPEGEVTEVRYDARGRVIETIRYDAAIDTTNLTGGVVTSALTSQLSAAAAANGRTTTAYAYIAGGYEVVATTEMAPTAQNAVSTRRFNAFGQEVARLERIDASNQREHTYAYDQRGLLTLTRWDPTGIDRTASNEYDAFGRLKRTTDQYGNQSRFEYDRMGRTLATVDPLNNRRTTTYDPFGRVLTTRDAFQGAQNTTSYAYNDSDRSVVITTPENISLTTVYNRHGQTFLVTAGGNTTEYTYDKDGRLTGVSDSMGSLESRTYDRAGRMLTSTDARSIVTTFAYDGASRTLTRIVDSGGGGLARLTTFAYDNHGRVTDVTEPNGVLTRTTYDRDGRVTMIAVDPNGLNLRTQYVYDNVGNAITVTEGVGGSKTRVTQYTFDKLGRRTHETVDPGGLNLVTQYKYDRNGNVTRRIDAENHSTWYVYDAADRLRFTIDALGGVTRNEYDVENRLLSTRRYATAVTPPGAAVDRVLFGDVMSALPSAANSRLEQHIYDRDGRERFTIDALGGVTERTYDANGNVTRVRLYANAVSGEHDTLAEITGAITQIVVDSLGANDRVQWHTYDLRNRTTFTTDALGGVVRNEYDGAGNVVRETAFAAAGQAGSTSVAQLEAFALTNAADVRNRVRRTWYDGAGRTAVVLDAEGYLTEIAYQDALLRSTQTRYATRPTVPAAATTAHLRARNNGVSIPAHALDQSTTTELDAGGRVVKVTDAVGNFETYGYDAVGNRTSFVNKKGAQWNYVYDANRRLSEEISPSVEVTTVTIQGNGLSASSTPPSYRIVTRMTYDALGNVRLRTEGILRDVAADIITQQRVTEYEYDALGRQYRTIHPAVGVYSAPAGDATQTNPSLMRAETQVALTSEVTFDVFGNATRQVDVAGNTSYKVYDALGRVRFELETQQTPAQQASSPKWYVSEHAYDRFGNEQQLTRYAAVLTSPPAYANDRIDLAAMATAVDAIESTADDRSVQTIYDRLNRVSSVIRPSVYNFETGAGAAAGYAYTLPPQTDYEYDAFGQVIHQLERFNDSASLQLGYSHTYFYYDRRGAKSAEVDALGYLTTFEYDAEGNLTRQVEYARLPTGTPTTASYGTIVVTTPGTAPAHAAGYDRDTSFVYDRLNRKISETRAHVEYATISGSATTAVMGALTSTFGYDAVGNQARFTDHTGAVTYTYYDALGRIRAIAEPSRDRGDGTSLTPLARMGRDAYGNLVAEFRLANGASAASETSFTPGAPVSGPSGDRTTLMRLDSHGRIVQTQDASGANRHASWTRRGDVAKEWRTITDADDALETIVTLREYDALGRQTAVIEPQRLGTPNVVRTSRAEYNAFGEIVRKTTDGIAGEETFEYDRAGRLWRTNGGDGVTRIYLHDLAGRATAEIRSQVRDLRTLQDAAATSALVATEQMRTETRYDKRGSVVEQKLPTFESSAPLAAIQGTFEIGTAVAGPSNSLAIYRRDTSQPPGIRYVVDPTATLAQHGGYYRTGVGPLAFTQDTSHQVVAAARIFWSAPDVAGVEAIFEYKIQGQSTWTAIPVGVLANDKIGVNVQGLANTQGQVYEYRVRYSRPPEDQVFAQATGTFRVDGTTSVSVSITPTPPDAASEIPALATSHSNGTLVWSAPADASVTAVLRLRLSGGSWTDYAATRVGGSFVVSGVFGTAGTYDFEIVHSRGGSVIARRVGQLSSTGTGNNRVVNVVQSQQFSALVYDSVATISGVVTGSVGARIDSSAWQEQTSVWPEGGFEPYDFYDWLGENRLVLSWATLGTSNVRVLVDYMTNGDYDAGSVARSREWWFSNGANGATITWDDDPSSDPWIGAPPRAGGIEEITRVRVYAQAGGALLLDQANPQPSIGRSLKWVAPSQFGLTYQFEVNDGGGYRSIVVVQSGEELTVDLNSVAVGTHAYRITYRLNGTTTATATGNLTSTSGSTVATYTIAVTPGSSPGTTESVATVVGQPGSSLSATLVDSMDRNDGEGSSWWTGTNTVNLTWTSIGSVPVRVELDYTTQWGSEWEWLQGDLSWNRYDVPPQNIVARPFTFSSAATGISLNWQDDMWAQLAGVSQINGVRVYTTDAQGNYTVLLRQLGSSSAPSITWTAPSTSTNAVFRYRTSPAVGWNSITPTRNGSIMSVNLTGVPANTYQYEIGYVRNGHWFEASGASGTFTVSGASITMSSPASFNLNTAWISGVTHSGSRVNWSRAPGGDTISFEYEFATNDWRTLTAQTSNGTDYWVDFAGFSERAYNYRISYRTGSAPPNAIGTGSVFVDVGSQTIQPTVTATQSNSVFSPTHVPVIVSGDQILWDHALQANSTVSVVYTFNGNTYTATPTGSGPNYSFKFANLPESLSPLVVSYQVRYVLNGQSEPYARAAGWITLTIDDQPVAPTLSIGSQAPAYPSGVQQIAAPTDQGDGWLAWSTAAEAGATVLFRYWATGASPTTLSHSPNGNGYRVSLAPVADGTYNYEITYQRAGESTPYARAIGTFALTRTTSITSVQVTDTTSQTLAPVPHAPRLEQTLDRWGQAIQTRDAAGEANDHRYNVFGQVIETRLPQVGITRTGSGVVTENVRPTSINYFDILGRLIATRDANGNLNKVTLNAAGQILVETRADGGEKRYRYDAFANQVEASNELGYRTRNAYDGANNLTSVSREVVLNGFTTAGPNDIVVDGYAYDGAGRRIRETNGLGQAAEYFYDLHGNLRTRRSAANRTTTFQYDVHGNKTREEQPLANTATWTYDYFGRVLTETDFAGYATTHGYDAESGLMLSQSSTSGLRRAFEYDRAGQLLKITDTTDAAQASAANVDALNRVTEYAYDVAGRRIRETTRIDGRTHQNTHLGYDEAGRLSSLDDLRYSLTYSYDANGNRTVTRATYFDHEQAERTQELWYRYDAMNRALVSQGVNQSGVIGVTTQQGVVMTYDLAGQRLSEYTHGDRFLSRTDDNWTGTDWVQINSPQWIQDWHTNTHEYDGLGRLLKTTHTALFEEYRDQGQGAGPELQSSGPSNVWLRRNTYDNASRLTVGREGTIAPAGFVERVRTSVFDADGLLLTQTTQLPNFSGIVQTESVVNYNNNLAGVLTGYSVDVYHTGFQVNNVVAYTSGNTFTHRKWGLGHLESGHTVDNSSGGPNDGSTARRYNVAGELVKFTDNQAPATNRHFANGASGTPLTVVQGNYTGGGVAIAFDNALRRRDNTVKAQHFFHANGQNVGSFGQLQAEGAGAFEANFDVSHRPISAHYPGPVPSQVVAQAGDTLRTLAARVFGDSTLWYVIAEENGLSDPDASLTPGQMLKVPNEVISLGNTATSFKPFDFSQAIGDTTPTQPLPPPPKAGGGACGFFGTIIVIVVTIIVAVWTAGALSAPAASAAPGAGAGAGAGGAGAASAGAAAKAAAISVGKAAVAAAAGNIAGQAVGIAIGVQDQFDWKGLASSALSAGLANGLSVTGFGEMVAGKLLGPEAGGFALRTAATAANAIAATALTQGIGVITGLQKSFQWRDVAISAVSAPLAGEVSGFVASKELGKVVSDAAGGIASALVRKALGGKVSAEYVLADVFGNAIGNGIVNGMTAAPIGITAQQREDVDRQIQAGYDQAQVEFDAKLSRDLARVGARIDLQADIKSQGSTAIRDLRADLAAGLQRDASLLQTPELSLPEVEPAASMRTLSGTWTLDPQYVESSIAAMQKRNSFEPALAEMFGLTEDQYVDSVRQWQRATAWKRTQIARGLQELGGDATLAVAYTIHAAVQPVLQAADLTELAIAGVHNLVSDDTYQLTGFSTIARATSFGEALREGLAYNPLGAVALGGYDLATGTSNGDALQAASGGFTLTMGFLGARTLPAGTAMRTPPLARLSLAPDSTTSPQPRFDRNAMTEGFQDHHIISDKHPLTMNHELLELAGYNLQSRSNKIFLPTEESLHPTRSIHRGKHLSSVSENLADQMNAIVLSGRRSGWTQQQYREALDAMVSAERQLLKSGERRLNKNARPWAE